MSDSKYSYKVTVSIITYNQADSIGKAVESAICQEVDFPYEIIIGDDSSIDGTQDILLGYRQKYPNLIKLNLHETRNDGIPGRTNNVTNIKSANGKYISFLDGDDYWISKDKLQRQADFMDTYSDYSFCFHNAWYIYEGIKEKKFSDQFFHLSHSCDFDIYDIARKKIQIPSGSVFMRKKYINDLPPWFWDVYRADHALQLIAAQHGSIRYMSDLLSGYEVHNQGMSQFFSEEVTALKIYKTDIDLFRQHIDIAPGNFMDARAEYCIELASKAFRKGKWFKAIGYLAQSIIVDHQSLTYLSSLLYAKVRRAIFT